VISSNSRQAKAPGCWRSVPETSRKLTCGLGVGPRQEELRLSLRFYDSEQARLWKAVVSGRKSNSRSA